MSLNTAFRHLCRQTNLVRCSRNLCAAHLPNGAHQRHYSLYEPDYLETGKSKIPLYDTLDVQIKGYDFPVLENYQSFVHSIAESMDIEVEDSWATPAQHIQVQKYKPQSTAVESQYKLLLYERNVQVVDLPTTKAAVFLEVIQAALPQGVTITVHQHQPEHDEMRYVPDLNLKELKTQLETLGGPVTKKK